MSGNKFGGLFGGNKKPETSEELSRKAAKAAADAEKLKAKQLETDAEEARELQRLEKQAADLKAKLAGKKGHLIEQEQRKQKESAETAAEAQKRLMEETIARAKGEFDKAGRDVQMLKGGKADIEHRIKQLQKALETNERETVIAEAHLVKARNALDSLINPKKMSTVPLSDMAAKRRSSEDRSSVEQKRGSNLSQASHDSHVSTSGMKVPPPLPKTRPVSDRSAPDIDIPGLGTLIHKGGEDVLVWADGDRNNPDDCFEVYEQTDNSITLGKNGQTFKYVQSEEGDWTPASVKSRSPSPRHSSGDKEDDIL